uniref:Programmed cell death protein 2 C-terminal domain-containing protein n=1 Tax=Tetraodon nigroviridis TaxID=99883 RepID=H3C823_TETNG
MAAGVPEGTLIGLCDGQLDDSKHRPTFLTNKVGGRPDWLPDICRPSPRCRCCGAPSVHVVQVYCPLDASPYHRNLHLFACPGPECSGRSESWTVLRSQGLEAPPAATDWCDGADDWGGGEEQGVPEEAPAGGGGSSSARSNIISTLSRAGGLGRSPGPGGEAAACRQLQRLRLQEQQAAPVLRSLFISVVEESDLGGEDEELRRARQLLEEYERREGAAVGGEETYEKPRARHGDAAFSRFLKRISRCPQQILRYCRGGRPLLLSEPPCSPAQTVPACGACGGSRTFELQLMPALVGLLQAADGGGGQVEFGTVLVYTCTASCWGAGSTGALEEACWVQQDPDQHLFR